MGLSEEEQQEWDAIERRLFEDRNLGQRREIRIGLLVVLGVAVVAGGMIVAGSRGATGLPLLAAGLVAIADAVLIRGRRRGPGRGQAA